MKDYVFRPRAPRPPTHVTITSLYYESRDCVVPMLRLRGLWLEEMGWRIGSRVSIHCDGYQIIITLVEPPPLPVPPKPKRLTRMTRSLARRAYEFW